MKYASLLPAFLLSAMITGAGKELPASAERITLVLDGNPRAVMVIPDGAGKTERFAAEELQKYIERISGARLDIAKEGARKTVEGQDPEISRVFVGNTRSAAPLRARLSGRDTDSFLVLAVEDGANDLFLTGVTERGTLWAVYDFLERELGCRWLGPEELWEEIPRQTDIEVPAGERIEEPAMKYRIGGRHTDWALKHKMNVSGRIRLPIEGMSSSYHEQEPSPMAMRGWRNWHSWRAFRDSLSLEHPEWFASDGHGARERRASRQMCFSNPEVHDYLAERFSRILREQPSLDFVEFGPCDGLGRNLCLCQACMDLDIPGDVDSRRGRQIHRWLAVVNAVADRLRETDPDKKLLATAYSGYQAPPDPSVIVPAPNVMMKYVTWDGCRLHGLEHTEEHDTRLDEMQAHAIHRDWMRTWHDITPAGMLMGEYFGRASMDGMSGMRPTSVFADMRYLRDNGWIGYWAIGFNWGMRMIDQYAAAKSMWNPDLDAGELVRDFCDHAFHAASEPMQRFIRTVEDAMFTAPCTHVKVTGWMRPEPLAEARRHLDDAHAAAAGDDTVQRRLIPWEMQFRYSEHAGPAWNMFYRVLKGERDPELLREAIRLGQETLAVRRELRAEYPDEWMPMGARLTRGVREGGGWHRLLEQLEKEQP